MSTFQSTAAAISTTRPGRIRYDYFETLCSAAGTCPMCGAPIEAHVPHACAKPDLDHPAHAVRPRCAPFESATFPFLVHRGMTCRFEGRVYRYTNYAPLYESRVRDSDLVESREHFYVLVGASVLEECVVKAGGF